MKYVIKGALVALMSVLCASVYAASYQPDMVGMDINVRASIAGGPRFINDDVMDNTRYSTAMEFGLGAYQNCKTSDCYYGLELFFDNAWDARFNSVNSQTDFNTTTALVHNSASMEALLFAGKDLGSWQAEFGVGAQISWVKWLGSPQFAVDRLRALPKLRASLNRKISSKTNLFLAVSQAFNPYGSMGCASGALNCIDDDGFVSITEVKLGASLIL
jgi:hypothetical protein